MNVGFFPDFKGDDAVLLDGTAEETERLANQLRQFVLSGESALPMHNFAAVSRRHPVQLYVSREHMKCDPAFFWKCAPDEIDTIHGKLEGLVSSAPGHQYFELANSRARLIISIGEYGNSWWQEHG